VELRVVCPVCGLLQQSGVTGFKRERVIVFKYRI
jgi:hypothetical protein